MKRIGTVLPTAKSLKCSDEFAKRETKKKEVAAELAGLSNFDKRYVGGEFRYYRNSTQYAVVNSHNEVCWFEIRGDGEYRI